MKLQSILLVAFALLFLTSCKRNIELFEYVTINGIQQRILIQGDPQKPIILYLHGGPGYSSILESHAYTDLLRTKSLVVQWDQRGTGYSYHEKLDTSTMSIDQMIEDTRALTEHLLKRFKKEKLFLSGHSWGSAIGFYTIKKYPDMYFGFIGANREEAVQMR